MHTTTGRESSDKNIPATLARAKTLPQTESVAGSILRDVLETVAPIILAQKLHNDFWLRIRLRQN